MIKSSSSYHQRTGETLSEAPSVCRPDCILHLPCAGVFFLQYKRLSPFTENVKEAIKQDKRLFFAFTKPFAEPASNVGIAEDDERNNKNVFTEVFCIKANK